MNIARSNTRDQFPLSPRKIFKKTLGSIIVFGLFSLVCLVLAFVVAPSTSGGAIALFVAALFFLFIILLAWLYQRWFFAVYFYDLTNDYIVIRKGPITPSEITIPYERIQDVYVDQDLLDRMLGLYDVHLSSATVSSGMSAHIDGVEKQAAEGLRAILLNTVKERISKHKGQDTVLGNTPPPAPPFV